MIKNLTIMIVFVVSMNIVLSQSNPYQPTVLIVSDINNTSSNGSSTSSVSTGKLGLSYRHGYYYGDVLFNVIKNDSDVLATDSVSNMPFSSNLLVPDYSGQGISNFNIQAGIRSFASIDENWDSVGYFSWKRIGVFGSWSVNNTIWEKGEISVPIYISSISAYVNYNILSLKLIGGNEEKIHLSFFAGMENRILGGDYSLDVEKNGMHFLGSNKRKFTSFPSVGFNLQIGQFYGIIKETNFDSEGSINGFSGWQMQMRLGVKVNIDITAKNTFPSIEEE